ncbi:GH12980 [Drosophila grimshawi]|uniref:DNA polymerase epsilon catalytic subunit n=1 Tax=Drosophila grimshawi TaxID=7222 RepID=B4K188_DROGR|nr:GH12980 [Drosophila grimshawi]
MFLRIIAEFKRLGATIVYADFNRIILSSVKKSVSDALGYVDYVVQSLRNKEMFHSMQLSFEQCWNFMLWLDQSNFFGIRGKLPKGIDETVTSIAAGNTTLRQSQARSEDVGEFSDLADWTDPCDTHIINEVICKACNHCRDLDLCKDKQRALKDGIPVWLCAQCYVAYDNEEIEMRMIDVLQRKVMSYVLQDLRCVRCNEIKRENLAEFCTCAGNFVPLISGKEIETLLNTFNNVASYHKMQLLQQTVQQALKTPR